MTTPDSGLPLRLRPAEDADAPALAELWATAFPGERSASERLEALLSESGKYGGIENCWVGDASGRMVGALRTYPLTLHMWGKAFPTMGLAAVAVAPEARRKGVGASMCRAALIEGRARGDLLSALYPFRTDFYGRLGYTLVGEYHRYRFPPGELPSFPETDGVEPLSEEAARDLVPDFYEAMLPRTNGLIARNEAHWEHLGEDSVRVLAVRGEGPAGPDGLRGYMAVSMPPYRRPEDARLVVRELLVSDSGSYRALLGWLSRQRDQWQEVTYDALPGERFHQLLGHPRRPGARAVRSLWFPSASILRGPMLRILDVPRLLEAIGFPEGASIEVEDPVLGENSGRWTGTGGMPLREEVEGAATPAPGTPVPGPAAIGTPATGTPPPGTPGTPRPGTPPPGPPPPGTSAPGTPPSGALPVRVVTELFASGAFPGIPEGTATWDPLLGLRDFRLWDAF